MQHGGLTRTYHVLVPVGLAPDEPAPLVLALHGGGGRGDRLPSLTEGQLRREADRRGWLVVLPDGVGRGWNDGREVTAAPRRDVDDVAFLAALLDRVAEDYAVDPRRVYVTGISNGGFMSITLALRLSERIAAAAPVTASLQKDLEALIPTRPVPILFMNGTEDPLVPYDGGQVRVLGRARGEILSTDASAAHFRALAGCTAPTKTRALPDLAPDDGTRVHVESTPRCAAAVVVYRIDGGGHTWPGGRPSLPQAWVGRVSRDIDATRHIFDFFAAHALP